VADDSAHHEMLSILKTGQRARLVDS
jgi:hypothetical protein